MNLVTNIFFIVDNISNDLVTTQLVFQCEKKVKSIFVSVISIIEFVIFIKLTCKKLEY